MIKTKRVILFIIVNLIVVGTLSILNRAFNLEPYLTSNGIQIESLLIFCMVWGFGGALFSLSMSRLMAKWMMRVQIIDPNNATAEQRILLNRVFELSHRAGIQKMPQVGVFESSELNAFATGPSRNKALVAVSSGLLQKMNDREIDGVLAHEVAHIANGDMVTMTLIQGVVNVFVMLLARVFVNVVGQFVDEERRSLIQFIAVLFLELAFGLIGMLVVSYFSRKREFAADRGGSDLSSRENMIAALQSLKLNRTGSDSLESSAIASLAISGKSGGLLRLLATHPDLEDRIKALENPR